jgi:glutathione S-transferase
VIQLHTMVPAWGLPTFTPFGLKLVVYMRLAKIPFELVVENDPRRGPKQKFPWLTHNDHVIADSGFAIDYLKENFGDPLDSWMTDRERSCAHAFRKMFEESLCFSLLFYRWTDDKTYHTATEIALQGIPKPIRMLIRPIIRRRILRDLWGQGVLRHEQKDVFQLAKLDLQAFATQLGDQPYAMGKQASSLDATACGFLAVLMLVPLENELKSYAQSLTNLVAYTQRMQTQCFAPCD